MPPPLETLFLGSFCNFKQLLFSEKKIHLPFTFYFFWLSGIFHNNLSTFLLFFFILPNTNFYIFFLLVQHQAVGKVRCDTMLPSILVKKKPPAKINGAGVGYLRWNLQKPGLATLRGILDPHLMLWCSALLMRHSTGEQTAVICRRQQSACHIFRFHIRDYSLQTSISLSVPLVDGHSLVVRWMWAPRKIFSVCICFPKCHEKWDS